jgi:replicative DNA helicase
MQSADLRRRAHPGPQPAAPAGRSSVGRVPPHNLDAERSLIGAMLLSRDAVAAAIEGCKSDDFYKPAHAHIFDAICALYARGEPADAVTVADELARAGLLELIGGLSALADLQADTPATTNAAYYARIVEEHALLRRLIAAAGEIAELGYSLPEDIEATIDIAEAAIFDVAERRVTDSLQPLHVLLEESLERLEQLNQRGQVLTGVPTGYTDLDEKLFGLQPSSLVIVGARPSMGKALALDTPIPTPEGWATMGALRAGDTVFSDTGTPCRVIYTSPVQLGRACYKVHFDDGSSIVADSNHRWLVYDTSPPAQRSPQVKGTRELLEDGLVACGKPRWLVPLAQPLDLPEQDLPMDPYELGRQLAAGEAPANTRQMAAGPAPADTRQLTAGPAPADPSSGPIPAQYLRASFKQRLSLLQGIMGTSGSSLPGGVAVLEHPERGLCLQARELACSLGHKPGPLREKLTPLPGGDGGGRVRRWRLSWTPLDPVFRLEGLEGKDSRLGSHKMHCFPGAPTTRSIRSIEAVESVPVKCISVDAPSHLYLAGCSMVPTHNTSFALGIAAHAAVQARVPTLFFSLEMGREELTQRLLSSEARVDSTRIRNGRLESADWSKVSQAIGRLGAAPLYIDDNPHVSIMEIRAKARRLKARESSLGLIIIDYLQLMQSRQSAENRQLEVSGISRGLKILARELKVPVVALSQLSRNLEMRADKRPILADLRESGSLEQDADVVLFLYRDEMYNADTADRGIAEVIVAKHRNGPTGKCQLAFLDHHTRFANMARV